MQYIHVFSILFCRLSWREVQGVKVKRSVCQLAATGSNAQSHFACIVSITRLLFNAGESSGLANSKTTVPTSPQTRGHGFLRSRFEKHVSRLTFKENAACTDITKTFTLLYISVSGF